MSKTVTVTLPPALNKLVKQELSTGLYQDAEAVLLEALRRLHEHKIAALRREIQLGLADIEAGRCAPLDMEDIKRKGRQILNRRRKAG